jgi:hypothetical protein
MLTELVVPLIVKSLTPLLIVVGLVKEPPSSMLLANSVKPFDAPKMEFVSIKLECP